MCWPPLVLTVGEVMVGLPRLLSWSFAVQNWNGEVSSVIICPKPKWTGVLRQDDSLLPWNATHVPKSPLLCFLRNWKSIYLLQWHINSSRFPQTLDFHPYWVPCQYYTNATIHIHIRPLSRYILTPYSLSIYLCLQYSVKPIYLLYVPIVLEGPLGYIPMYPTTMT